MAEYISFQPSDFFSTKLYTGTGSSNAITGVGFQPDFTWIKNRDAADFHVLTDAVRGATKYWRSDNSAVEATDAESLKSFDSDGFTVGTQAEVNTNTEKYVSWNWKAGTTSGLSGGTITPTGYSLNTTAGQSIIAYTGAGAAGTVPHGLGKTPAMIIVKCLGDGYSGMVYNAGINNGVTPADYYIKIDGTGDQEDAYGAGAWNDTLPTSTVFSVGGNNHTSGSFDYIAYCFADIKGYSKFGAYTGTGDASISPFIYTGFRPAYTMIKQSSGSGTYGWYILDSKRAGYNPDNEDLLANTTGVEDDTNNFWDLTSTGFKIKTAGGNINTSGSVYVYAAFAEFPLVSSNDVPTVAR